jgi:HPt (histidine-containing phosphotransfer) domain-containing protein
MILDEAGALDRVSGDRDLLRELIAMFGVEGPQDLAKIEASVAARDAHGLHIAAHKLKGSVGIFCAQDAYEAAFVLERMGKFATWEGVDAALKRLKEAMTALQPELERLARE